MNRAILLVHLAGLALALGGAAMKVSLLLAFRADPRLTSAYVRVAPVITRLLVTGLVLLTTSGIAFIVLGHPTTTPLIVKVALVVILWGLGPVIDKVAEPAFVRLARSAGPAASPEFARAHRRYLALELVATGLMSASTVLGVLT
jgi:hypothetical protein